MRCVAWFIAVMLDGGISAQMLVWNDGGAVREWRGFRSLPLGLVVLPRPLGNPTLTDVVRR